MDKALTKVGSLKSGTFWVSKKAKEEISNISQDLTVMILPFSSLFVSRLYLNAAHDEILCVLCKISAIFIQFCWGLFLN